MMHAFNEVDSCAVSIVDIISLSLAVIQSTNDHWATQLGSRVPVAWWRGSYRGRKGEGAENEGYQGLEVVRYGGVLIGAVTAVPRMHVCYLSIRVQTACLSTLLLLLFLMT